MGGADARHVGAILLERDVTTRGEAAVHAVRHGPD